MVVGFYKGALRTETGADVAVSWAETGFGMTARVAGADELLHEFNADQLIAAEPIATLELPGLDRDGIEIIVRAVLEGRYLDMPGVKGKGDALLFILVNEALHRLAEIAKDDDEQ
jgi:hypothetical protein